MAAPVVRKVHAINHGITLSCSSLLYLINVSYFPLMVQNLCAPHMVLESQGYSNLDDNGDSN